MSVSLESDTSILVMFTAEYDYCYLLLRDVSVGADILKSWPPGHIRKQSYEKKFCLSKGFHRSCTFNFTALPCFLRNIRHITVWAELRIFMNSLPSFHTTKINFLHSSYTPRVCRALPYVSELTATELIYNKLYVNKINDFLNIEYLLQYKNVFK